MANTQERALEFTPQALDVLGRMADRLHAIKATFGEGPEYAKATESFAHCMIQLVRMGGRVMWDGDLSFVVNTQVGIVMGVNWSPTTVTRDGFDEIPKEWQVAGSWSCNS